DPGRVTAVGSPRPGPAGLAGALKCHLPEARYVLERASARESGARVAVGAVAKLMLAQLEIEVLSHVIAVGSAARERPATWNEVQQVAAKEDVLLSCVDQPAEAGMKEELDRAI